MTIFVRQPFVIYVFNEENKGSVFARFASLREAESFCQEW
jgi:hypothetical protein